MEPLLAVADQHVVAGLADLGTIFLEAGQNHQIALIHDVAAKLLHVAGAGLLLSFGAAAALGLLGQCAGRNCIYVPESFL